MRVLVATPLYPPEAGGPATYSRLLERGLPSMLGNPQVEVVKFSEFRKFPKLVRNVAYFFVVLVKAVRADIVLVLDPVSTGLPAVVSARLCGKPVVVKVVGDYAWEQGRQRARVTQTLDEFVKTKDVPMLCKFFRAVQTFVARSATKVIVPSEYLKKIVSAWGVKENKIEVIYNAIELPDELPSIKAPDRYIVTVGRLVPWKHIDAVIDVYGELRKKYEKLALVVIGDGPERMRLSARAEEVGGTILFTGQLGNSETHAYLARSSVFVLNSSYEGLSHVLIEALIEGCAVVATDAGGNSEVVRDRENGLLVNVGDSKQLESAIDEFLTNDTLRMSLTTRAQKVRDEFSLDRMLTRTYECLQRLV